MLDYGTYYGGTGNGTNADAGIGVAVDSNGNGYITGATFSTDLVTMNAAISTFQGPATTPTMSNAFVAEFNPTAANGPASLVYATYLGGSGATGTIVLNVYRYDQYLGRRCRHRNSDRFKQQDLGYGS